MKQKRIIIGIVGRIAAGKDEAAKYLHGKLGWPVFQISAPLKAEVRKRGLELNRKNMQEMGEKFAKTYGDDYLAKLALKSFKQNGIVSGPRQLGQIKYFRSNSRFILVFIDAADKIRFERAKSRGIVNEAKTLNDFARDEIEKDVIGDIVKLDDCIEMADYKVENNSTIENLGEKLDEIIDREITPIK